MKKVGLLIGITCLLSAMALGGHAEALDSSDSSEYLDKKINGRGFAVKRVKWSRDFKDLRDCNILFVSSSEKEHIESVIDAMKGLPILTIGDAPGFAKRGGIINFMLEDNKVRFEVNVEAAKHADLTISSRLLTLARIVQQAAADGRKPE